VHIVEPLAEPALGCRTDLFDYLQAPAAGQAASRRAISASEYVMVLLVGSTTASVAAATFSAARWSDWLCINAI
jgi:hypothetical protein